MASTSGKRVLEGEVEFATDFEDIRRSLSVYSIPGQFMVSPDRPLRRETVPNCLNEIVDSEAAIYFRQSEVSHPPHQSHPFPVPGVGFRVSS